MRSSKQVCAALCVAGLLGTASGSAIASEQDAKALFAQGREMRTAGKCMEAITAFRRALEINPSGLGALRNIAECEEKLGMYASARVDWWDLRRAVLQTNEPKYDGWDKDAERAHAALAAKVPKVVINLSGDKLDRVKIVLDGKPLDPRLLGIEIERDMGDHVVEAFFGSVTPVTAKLTLAEGARETVTLTIPSAAPEEKPKPPVQEPDRSKPALRTAGFIALGVGGASAVATVISIVVRAGALSDLEEGCTSQDPFQCPSRLQGSYDTGVTASTLVNVFGGVAIAGLGAGAALVVMSSRTGSTTTTTTAATTTAQRGRQAVSATFEVAPTLGGAHAQATVRF